MSKLFSIGELLIDFQSVGTASLKDTREFVKNAGGAPANVCVQAAKFGKSAVYLSKVGQDGFGEFLIETLEREGVDISFISKSRQYDTSLAFVSFGADGEREFSFYRKNAADLYFTPEDFKGVEFTQGDILEFGSVALKTKEARKTHDVLIQKARKAKALIAFDPNLRFNLWEDSDELKRVVREYLPYADILKLGSDELEFLTEQPEAAAVKQLFSGNLKILLITYGSKGARIYLFDGQSYYCPGYSVRAVDTTGAGDSFFGAFLAELLDSSLHEADYETLLDIACRCGAYTAMHFGAIPAMGTKETVMKEVRQYGHGKTCECE